MLLFCLVDEFMLTIYGQNFVTEDKYSSDTEPFHGFSDAEILAAGGTIRGPTPSSDPSTTMASKQQSSWGLGSEERQILSVNSLPGQDQPDKPPSRSSAHGHFDKRRTAS